MDTKTAGRRGGRSRAANMTPEQRREAADKARRARWDRIDALSDEIATASGAEHYATALKAAADQAGLNEAERSIVVQRVLSYVVGWVS